MNIQLKLMAAGYCTHPEFMVRKGGQRKSVPFPAIFALLRHPRHGPILFDTGYTSRFHQETAHFPANLHAKLTPMFMQEKETAVNQLAAQKINPSDVRFIILSHFHADHIGGVIDFPNATYIYLKEAYDAVANLTPFGTLRAGFLPGLLPPDFRERSRLLHLNEQRPIDKRYAPFTEGIDIFGDQTVTAIHLPGHATGQIGLLVTTTDGPIFLAVDACWQSGTFRHLQWPHPLATLALADKVAFKETVLKLHQLHQQNPTLPILPFHCQEVYDQYVLGKNK